MIITVKVKTRSSEQKVVRLQKSAISDSAQKHKFLTFGDNRFLIYLKEEPENNKANIELINLLSKYFGIPHTRIRIKIGANSSDKLIELS